jgi:hypothetical protein
MAQSQPVQKRLLRTGIGLIILGLMMVVATIALGACRLLPVRDDLVMAWSILAPVSFVLGHLLISIGTPDRGIKAVTLAAILCSPGPACLVVGLADSSGGGTEFDAGGPFICLACPICLVLAILSVIAIANAGKPSPTRPRRSDLCGQCGYNLTGLTESRCPECGTGFEPSLLPRLSADAGSEKGVAAGENSP